MLTGTMAMLLRAIRLDARLVRTHLFRLAFALLVYASLIYAQIISGTTLLGAPGLKLFNTMTYLNLMLISLAGVSFFATAITEEKEEETLGLLKMAGVNPLGILLGKSTSRLLGAILLLLVQFPFTLLAITLGGVTLGQVVAAYCSLTAYMVLLANVGLFSSVVCRRGGSASLLTLLFLSVYLASHVMIETIRLGLSNGGLIAGKGAIAEELKQVAKWCRSASVLDRISDIMLTGFSETPLGFQVNVSFAGALLFFGVAWGGFHRFTREPRSGGRRQIDPLERLIRFGQSHRSRPGRNALAWKEFHFAAGGIPVQVVKFLLYGLTFAVVFLAAERYFDFPFADAGMFVAMFMLLMLVVESGLYAAVIFHDEWRGRTLPLLAMLPLRPSTVIYSKIAGCLPALLPAMFWLLAGCVIWPDGFREIFQCLYLPSRWLYGLIWLLFLTLTAFFSLVVRWGALPLAISVMAFGASVASCCGSPLLAVISISNSGEYGAELGFLLVDIVVAVLVGLLQSDIRRRLEIASSQ